MSDEAQRRAIAAKRVVLELPHMTDADVRRDVPFGMREGDPLTLDVYYPRARRPAGSSPALAELPAVVIVAGYPDTGFQRMLGCRFKEMGSSVSWAQLVAATGMVAITYGNREPAGDLATLIGHLRGSGAELGVDPSRLALWASSGNVPLALWALMDGSLGRFACAALCYGLTLDLDGSTAVAEASKSYGFVNPAAGRSVDDLPTGVPLLLARAGQDQFAGLNDAMDRFVAHALRRNLPVTLTNHPAGPHAFDLFDEGETSREIVRVVLRFLQFHLEAAGGR